MLLVSTEERNKYSAKAKYLSCYNTPDSSLESTHSLWETVIEWEIVFCFTIFREQQAVQNCTKFWFVIYFFISFRHLLYYSHLVIYTFRHLYIFFSHLYIFQYIFLFFPPTFNVRQDLEEIDCFCELNLLSLNIATFWHYRKFFK